DAARRGGEGAGEAGAPFSGGPCGGGPADPAVAREGAPQADGTAARGGGERQGGGRCGSGTIPLRTGRHGRRGRMSGRRVLVTGGAGFIGSHVAEAYRDRGDRVWIVDDLSSGRASNVPDGVEFRRMDIGDPDLDALFREAGGFDVVNHHAAQIDVRKSVADPRMDARINIDGLLNVLECARRHGVGRFVFVSSGGVVYGEAETRPTPERAPKQPLSPYGVTKLSAEYYLYYYHQVHGLDYAALRYSNVYGPRQDPHGEAGV